MKSLRKDVPPINFHPQQYSGEVQLKKSTLPELKVYQTERNEVSLTSEADLPNIGSLQPSQISPSAGRPSLDPPIKLNKIAEIPNRSEPRNMQSDDEEDESASSLS